MENEAKGFIKLLTDLSFTDFVTTRLIKIIYVLAMVFAGLTGLGVIAGGFVRGSSVNAVIGLIMGPVVFLLMVLSARIWLELVIVVFRIAEHTASIAESVKKEEQSAPGEPEEDESEEK